jgi:RNA polymerase sigma-70 factor (ECF subfamily)
MKLGEMSGRDADMDSGDRLWRERGMLRAVLAGDERAWHTWYDESFAGLYAYACWRCAGLRDLADDVVQETWLTAVRRIRSFDPERGSFAGWLRGIAANVVRNHLRRRQARRTVPLNGRHAAKPDTSAEGRVRAERIARTLGRLSERHEAVLRAKYLEQQGVEQIAADWGEMPKTIESLLTRARAAFRDAYVKLESSDE